MARYLIPKPITRQYELFPGWGLAEAGLVVASVMAGAVVFGLASLVGLPVGLRIVFPVALVAVGVGLAFPPPMGEPAYRVVQRWWAYQHQPHRYLYDWTASDWPDDDSRPSQ